MLRRGEIDLAFSYRSQVEEAGLPFVKLPEEVNLGVPYLAESYAEASYLCTDGTRYCGAPIAYTATPLINSKHPLAVAAFLVFMTSDEATDILQQHNFRAAREVMRRRNME
jgi:molybdate/tungstate transport system substrate-binding protein